MHNNGLPAVVNTVFLACERVHSGLPELPRLWPGSWIFFFGSTVYVALLFVLRLVLPLTVFPPVGNRCCTRTVCISCSCSWRCIISGEDVSYDGNGLLRDVVIAFWMVN